MNDHAEKNAAGTPVGLPGLPVDLHWLAEPSQWDFDGEVLTLAAPGETDLFTDPQGEPPVSNAPALVFEPEGDFVFSAKVKVAFRASFDAGVLLVYQNADSWAKLCFEYEPQGFPPRRLGGDERYFGRLQLAVFGREHDLFAGRARRAGLRVSPLVRRRGLAPHPGVRPLFLSPPPKSVCWSSRPSGEGCSAEFYRFGFTSDTLQDIRSGE